MKNLVLGCTGVLASLHVLEWGCAILETPKMGGFWEWHCF